MEYRNSSEQPCISSSSVAWFLLGTSRSKHMHHHPSFPASDHWNAFGSLAKPMAIDIFHHGRFCAAPVASTCFAFSQKSFAPQRALLCQFPFALKEGLQLLLKNNMKRNNIALLDLPKIQAYVFRRGSSSAKSYRATAIETSWQDV